MPSEKVFLLANAALNLGLLGIFIVSPLMRNVAWQRWFFWLMITTLLDGVTTFYWVPIAEEANPIARYLFGRFVHLWGGGIF